MLLWILFCAPMLINTWLLINTLTEWYVYRDNESPYWISFHIILEIFFFILIALVSLS